MPLTDTRIRSLKAKDRPYRLADGGALHLEVRPTGAKLWRYRYRLGKKENIYAIGIYPDVSLAEAREARDAARKLVRKGVHPLHQRKTDLIRAAYEGANTFRTVATEWLEENRKHWTPRTLRHRQLLLARDVYPAIGDLPMRQVTSGHAYTVLQAIEGRAPHMAVLARQALSGISRLAIATMRADTDVAYPLRHSVRTAPTVHKTPLRPNQIPGFFRALDMYAGYLPTKGAIRLLWWTLARPGEVIGARWAEFDLDNAHWTVPATRMKMRQPHTVPLPRQAVEHLRSLRAVHSRDEFLLPSRATPKRHASPTIINKAVSAMGYEGKFSAHGIRVTGRTILGEQGHPRDVLERQLAHRDKKEVRAYDQGDRLEARRVVMQTWADYLDGLTSGATATNILPIDKRIAIHET